VKKARGGVASRKAKANSIAASAARSKGKPENQQPTAQHSSPPPSEVLEDEQPSVSTPSKVGDLSFVLNGPSDSPRQTTPSKSPNLQSVKQQPKETPTSTVLEPPPTFTPAEPAHNRIVPKLKLFTGG
jgi:hypothetical protein